MDDLPQQKDANNQTGGEKNDGNTQQVNPSDGNDGIQSVLSDNIFRFLASVSIVTWMIHEFVFDTHKIFLFTAIVFGLADAFYVLAHKIFTKLVMAIICWVIFGFCVFLIFKNEALPETKSLPHLTLEIGTSEDPNVLIPITNELGIPDNLESLVIPVNSGNTSVEVQFELINDSSNTIQLLESQINFQNVTPVPLPRNDGSIWRKVFPITPPFLDLDFHNRYREMKAIIFHLFYSKLTKHHV
jgi:hypothetical protein